MRVWSFSRSSASLVSLFIYEVKYACTIQRCVHVTYSSWQHEQQRATENVSFSVCYRMANRSSIYTVPAYLPPCPCIARPFLAWWTDAAASWQPCLPPPRRPLPLQPARLIAFRACYRWSPMHAMQCRDEKMDGYRQAFKGSSAPGQHAYMIYTFIGMYNSSVGPILICGTSQASFLARADGARLLSELLGCVTLLSLLPPKVAELSGSRTGRTRFPKLLTGLSTTGRCSSGITRLPPNILASGWQFNAGVPLLVLPPCSWGL